MTLDIALAIQTAKITGTAILRAFSLIASFEGFEKVRPDGLVEAYLDKLADPPVWTIGAGVTGKAICDGTVWTREDCAKEVGIEVARIYRTLVGAGTGAGLLKRPTTSGQLAALISFAYNLGTNALAGSTLLRLFNAGDVVGAARQFDSWIHAGGKILPGLVRRRALERDVFEGNA